MSVPAIEETPKKPVRRSDFGRGSKPKLLPDAAKRQGDITTLAFKLLGGKDGAIAYLNTDSAAVGGRPLDVATASDEGWLAVEGDIQSIAAGDRPQPA